MSETVLPRTSPGMEEILRVEGLSKSFSVERSFSQRAKEWFGGQSPSEVRALDSVGFTVGKSETLGILGESGSGKSTLARILMGLCKPDSGTARLLGKDLFSNSYQERLVNLRNLQMVFQDPFSSLDPRMRVRDILLEPLKVHSIPANPPWEKLMESALEEVGLEKETLDRYPSEFSGGQRQRIGISRALILNPLLLIADEAVSALDVSVQAQILELLKRLKDARNLAMIFISHDVALVKQFVDRILVFFRGRVIESLTPSCLLEDSVHPYTRKLLKAALELREGIYKPHVAGKRETADSQCPYFPWCDESVSECRDKPDLVQLHPGHHVACRKAMATSQY